MLKEDRIEIIKKIEEARKSKVITLVNADRANLPTQLNQSVVDTFYTQLKIIKEKETDNKNFKNLDLFLYSRGGDSDAPWSIVSTIREVFPDKNFNVLIPYRAHSAATMISIGADEIIMGEKGELGPIDITIHSSPFNPTHPINKMPLPVSVEDVMGYVSFVEKLNCDRPEEKIKALEILTKDLNPLALGNVNRLLEQTKLVANRMLSSRKEQLPRDKNDEIVKKLSSEIFSHRHTISRSEAKQLGLDFVKKAEDYKIASFIWELYQNYANDMELTVPFDPNEYLQKNNLDSYTWEDVKTGYIESTYDSHLLSNKITAKLLRQITQPININPQIALDVNNIHLPDGINGEQVKVIIQTWLNQNLGLFLQDATKVAIESFIKSQPAAQVEISIKEQQWKRI